MQNIKRKSTKKLMDMLGYTRSALQYAYEGNGMAEEEVKQLEKMRDELSAELQRRFIVA